MSRLILWSVTWCDERSSYEERVWHTSKEAAEKAARSLETSDLFREIEVTRHQVEPTPAGLARFLNTVASEPSFQD